MNYLQTNNRSRSIFSNKLGVSLIVIVVLIILLEVIFPAFLPAIFMSIARPYWRVRFALGNGSLSSFETIQVENDLLKQNLSEILTRSNVISDVVAENVELKSLLRRVNTKYSLATSSSIMSATSSATSTEAVLLKPSPYTLAAVLKRPPLALYDEMIIDIGSDDDVNDGDLVYAPGNIILGRVVETLSQTSKILLFSSPGLTYDVLIGPGKVPAVSTGKGGGTMSAQVPKSFSIQVGDIVTVPSVDNQVIGRVSSVNVDSAQPFETVLFTSMSNIYEMRWVLVDARVNSKTDIKTSSTTQVVSSANVAPKSTTKNVKK